MIEEPAGEDPEGVAIHLCHHGSEPEAVRWRALWHEARMAAAQLQDAGLQHGDRVILIQPTSRAFFSSFFGIILAGGIPVPTAQPTLLKGPSLVPYLNLLRTIASDCAATFCLCPPRLAEVLAPCLHAVNPHIQTLPPTTEAPPPLARTFPAPAPEDTALIQYTSGSTSHPKGVVLSHRNILANIRGIVARLHHPGDVVFSWLPLYHDMGLIGTLLASLYARAPVVFMPPKAFVKRPARWLRGISDYSATVTVAPNFAFHHCVQTIKSEQVDDLRLDSLRVALNGAEPVDPEAVRRFEETFRPLGLRPGTVRPVYGLAESALAVTFSEPGHFVVDHVEADRMERCAEAVPSEQGTRRRALVSVGRPIPGQQVRIVDEAGQPLPERRVGEIVVKGASVMQGYYNRPEETARVLREGWLHTGDLGYLAEGRLYIAGRSKDLIIRHGRNLHPKDLEYQVQHVEGVRPDGVVVFSIDDEAAPRLVVVAETRVRDADTHAAMERAIRERIHRAFLFGPDVVRFVKPGRIPRTTSGKVQRQKSKQRYLRNEF